MESATAFVLLPISSVWWVEKMAHPVAHSKRMWEGEEAIVENWKDGGKVVEFGWWSRFFHLFCHGDSSWSWSWRRTKRIDCIAHPSRQLDRLIEASLTSNNILFWFISRRSNWLTISTARLELTWKASNSNSLSLATQLNHVTIFLWSILNSFLSGW